MIDRIFVRIVAVAAACAFLSCGAPEPAGYADDTLFEYVPSSHSNIDFENRLSESENFNIIEYLYFYNGGGVATGDINNDGLIDIFFSSNQGNNRLYLNKGDMVFDDISEIANITGKGNWKTGVAMADVNGDGLLDVYVCGVGNYKDFDGSNQLFINNGDLTFTDRSAEYGLDFKGFSTHSAFFDYDNDGDLDMYLLNHAVHTSRSYGDVWLRFQRDSLAGDRLYQNQLIETGKTTFRDVTSRAGILSSQIGYGLGIGVSDVNHDGLMDIFVANDFHENDYLYLNNGDGTFDQELEHAMPHTSRFSMGVDIADINNDGRNEILSLDMLPKEEAVIKTSAGEDPYEIFQYKLQFGYHYQYARNALQLHRGVDKEGRPLYSDMAPLAGVEATDWSWSALMADFDNDGWKDLFITNGIDRRPNDMDYISFITDENVRNMEDRQLIAKMPLGKVSNVMYRNSGDLTFDDVTRTWIGERPCLSNGAAYADLDNDGDLDLVVNNLNETAFLMRNNGAKSGNYIQLSLEGEKANRFGIGAKVMTWAQGKVFYHEQSTSRGWLSSVSPVVHIGIGDAEMVDSLTVIWPQGNFATFYKVAANQHLVVKESNSVNRWEYRRATEEQLLEVRELEFKHRENRYSSFNEEILTPHMLTTQGPKIAVADVDGDGLDDFFVGGASGQPGAIYQQRRNSTFLRTEQPEIELDSMAEDVACVFADADGDGDPDLIVAGGGQQFDIDDRNLQPRVYRNESGVFERSPDSFPDIKVNGSCVTTTDVDGDGDVDVFIGGRVVPGSYGLDPPSYLLLNEGNGRFKDVTLSSFGKRSLGMVTGAIWSDFNGDGKMDLAVAGEWMPISIFIQRGDATFADETEAFGLTDTHGWWNTIYQCDIDNDGDIDLLAGNLGRNSRLRPTPSEPVNLYVQDLDQNGSLDQIITYFNGGRSWPFLSRDQLVKQVPSYKKAYLRYANYDDVTIDSIITPHSNGTALQKRADTFSSLLLLREDGTDRFKRVELPPEAQMFPIFAFLVDDVNNDGRPDIMGVGNWYAVQPDFGRYDAGYGTLLINNGDEEFLPSPLGHGFYVSGEGRDIKHIKTSSSMSLYLVARNNEALLAFQKRASK